MSKVRFERPASTGQMRAMVGILALQDDEQSCGVNIRTLFYRWIRNQYISPTGIYSTLRTLEDRQWATWKVRPVTALTSERKFRTYVWRLTEAGYRALVNSYTEALWLGKVNRRAQAALMRQAEEQLAGVVLHVRELAAANQ